MRLPKYTAMNGKVIDLTEGGLAYFIVTGLEGGGGALPTWINFEPRMDQQSCPLVGVGWNYLSIPNLHRYSRCSLGMDAYIISSHAF